MLIAATPSGSNARAAARLLGLIRRTAESQPLEERPHAASTRRMAGAQHAFRVRDSASDHGQALVKHLGTFV